MPAPIRYDLTAAGLTKLYGRAGYKASATPQVQVTGTWTGNLVFSVDTNPHGGIVAGSEAAGLTNWPFKVQGTYDQTYLAGTVVASNGIYEFNTGGLPLWVTVSGVVTGTITLTVIPDAVPTPAPTTVLLSNGITLDSVPMTWTEELTAMFEGAIANTVNETVSG